MNLFRGTIGLTIISLNKRQCTIRHISSTATSSTSAEATGVKVQPLNTQISLSNLSPLSGSHILRKRVGRGGKRGGSAGRGNGGQKHHGQKPQPWFTGLYTNPIIHALPKYNSSPRHLRPRLHRLNLDKVQWFIDMGRLPGTGLISMRDLYRSGILIGGIRDGVKLMGNGAEYFKARGLRFEVTKASRSAIARVEELEGQVRTVYHTRRGLLQVAYPERFPVKIAYARPVLERELKYYSDPANRGYLSSPEIFETEFQSRGYLATSSSAASPPSVIEVQQQFAIDEVEDLLSQLKEKREVRQAMYLKEQQDRKRNKEEEAKRWKDQQWFKYQPIGWKWIEIDMESKTVQTNYHPNSQNSENKEAIAQ